MVLRFGQNRLKPQTPEGTTGHQGENGETCNPKPTDERGNLGQGGDPVGKRGSVWTGTNEWKESTESYL